MYQDWFEFRPEHQEKIFVHAINPDVLTPERLAQYDGSAARDIKRLESVIEDLRQYRIALAERYNRLVVMPFSLSLSLVRQCQYSGKKIYRVNIDKVYQDGTRCNVLNETYPGAERHKAIARCKELQRLYPGIDTTIDIKTNKIR